MFQRIAQYDLMAAGGRVFRPRAYADQRTDGLWDGWLVFFPITGAQAIASDRETTQPDLETLTAWAVGLGDVYLAGALDRALRLAEQPPIVAGLVRAEYEALADAERLETTAELERVAAKVDEEAAATARADAREIQRERVATEQAIATTEELAAKAAAAGHEGAAKRARAVAADARRRRTAAKAHKSSK
jgi:hypothetical protein